MGIVLYSQVGVNMLCVYCTYMMNGEKFCSGYVERVYSIQDVPIDRVMNRHILTEYLRVCGGFIPHFQVNYSVKFEL